MIVMGIRECADFKVFLPEIYLSAVFALIYVSAVSALKSCFSGGDPQKPSALAAIVGFAGSLLS